MSPTGTPVGRPGLLGNPQCPVQWVTMASSQLVFELRAAFTTVAQNYGRFTSQKVVTVYPEPLSRA